MTCARTHACAREQRAPAQTCKHADMRTGTRMCVCVCVCVRARTRVRVRAQARAQVRAPVCARLYARVGARAGACVWGPSGCAPWDVMIPGPDIGRDTDTEKWRRQGESARTLGRRRRDVTSVQYWDMATPRRTCACATGTQNITETKKVVCRQLFCL